MYRYYDKNIDEDDIFYSELQVSLLKTIEKYNFDVFYFNCSAKTNFKIPFRDSKYYVLNNTIVSPNAEFWNLNYKTAEIENSDVIIIKNLLSQDMNYFYKNKLFEIIYKFPKLNSNNNYYFDFLLVVNKNFDINKIYNNRFNLIKIESVNKLEFINISQKFIKNKFQSRIIFNNWAPINDKNSYNFESCDISIENFIKDYNYNNPKFEWEQYMNIKSYIHHKNVQQDEYMNYCFKLLDGQIWSMDRNLVKIKNKHGFRYSNIEIFCLNSKFLSISEFIEEKYGVYCLYDLSDSYSLSMHGLNKNLIKNKIIDFDSLPILSENEFEQY